MPKSGAEGQGVGFGKIGKKSGERRKRAGERGVSGKKKGSELVSYEQGVGGKRMTNLPEKKKKCPTISIT